MRAVIVSIIAACTLLCPASLGEVHPAHKALIERTYGHLLGDADKAVPLFQFSQPDAARQLVPALSQAVRQWQELRALSVQRFNQPLADAAALGPIGMPLHLPPLNKAESEDLGDRATVTFEDEGVEINLVRTAAGWQWDADRQLRVEEPQELAQLLVYLQHLHKVLAQAGKEVQAGRVGNAADLRLRVDRLMCLEVLKPHLADAREGPPPRVVDGETRLASGVGRISCLAVSPDGKFAVTGAIASGTPLRLWNLETRKLERILDIAAAACEVHAVTFSPDGRTIAAVVVSFDEHEVFETIRGGVAKSPFKDWSGRFAIHLFEVATGRAHVPLEVERELCEAIAVSPDGKLLAAPGAAQTHVWELATRRKLPGAPPGSGATFMADGSLVVLELGYAMDVSDAWTGQSKRRFSLSMDNADTGMNATAVAPDGKAIAYAGATHAVVLNSSTGKILRRVRLHPRGFFGGDHGLNRVNSIQFSRDGSRMLLSSGLYYLDDKPNRQAEGLIALVGSDPSCRVTLHDSATGRIIKAYEGHAGTVSGAAFIENEQAILSSSTDGTLRIWKVPAPATAPAIRPATAPAR